MSESGNKRGSWSSRLGFILAASGSAIGLGNIWKFPYITYQNKGGAFVLVYLICIAAIGMPIMVAEMMIGRRTQKNAVGALRELGGRNWRFLGAFGVVTGFVLLSYYSVVAGWTLEYFLKSLTGAFAGLSENEVGAQFGEFVSNPSRQVLWHFVFMGLTIGVVAAGIAEGIERVTKTLMPILFLILIILVVQAFMTGGGGQALTFLFRPSFSELTFDSILEAVGHSFFTLSLGMGTMITYGSYMGAKESLPKSALIVCSLDTLVAIMACLVIYPIIFSFDLTPTKSAGILFTTLPVIFVKMPGGVVFAPLFFILVAFAALTSTISLLEVAVAYCIDELRWKRMKATIIVGGAIFAVGLLPALSNGAVASLSSINILGKVSRAGVFNTFDYLVSNWMLTVGGLLVAIFVGWRLAEEVKDEEFNKGEKAILHYKFWNFMIKFVAPLAVAMIIFAVIFLGKEFN